MSISSLVATLPDLENISLAGNRLNGFSELNSLSTAVGGTGVNNSQKQGLHKLRELILTGNPIRVNAEKEGTSGLQTYLVEACRRFPSLQILDGETIDPAVRANLPPRPDRPAQRVSSLRPNVDEILASTRKPVAAPEVPMPFPVKSAFFDNESTSSIVSAFCLQFFSAFDNDRASLIDAYATKATFSLCASPAIPMRAKCAGLTRNRPDMPAQQAPSWHEYINISRNTARLKGPSKLPILY